MIEMKKLARRVQQDKELKHSPDKPASSFASDHVSVFKQNNISEIVTSFKPSIEIHRKALDLSRSEDESVKILTRLQRYYGNSYVQRLVEYHLPCREAMDEEGSEQDLLRPQNNSLLRPNGSETEVQLEGSDDEFQYFPDISAISQSVDVEAERAADWSAGEADNCERFGWIRWDSETYQYSVTGKAKGNEFQVSPAPIPADNYPVFTVGNYHQHPPLTAAMLAEEGTYPIGPSDADQEFANNNNSPGIVRDYTDTFRTSVADYTYGPDTRI
jgi:hypothetical protein